MALYGSSSLPEVQSLTSVMFLPSPFGQRSCHSKSIGAHCWRVVNSNRLCTLQANWQNYAKFIERASLCFLVFPASLYGVLVFWCSPAACPRPPPPPANSAHHHHTTCHHISRTSCHQQHLSQHDIILQAGAIHGASRRSCGARCRRWAAATVCFHTTPPNNSYNIASHAANHMDPTQHLIYALITHHSSHTTHLAPFMSHDVSRTTHPTALLSNNSSHTTHLTHYSSRTLLISHTTHHTPLFSHHSSHTTHLTPLFSHHSSHTTNLTTTHLTHYSSHTTHLTHYSSHTLLISHTTHHTPLFSHHSSHTTHLTPLFSHHSSHTTNLTTTHLTHYSSHTTHLTPLFSHHSSH